MNLIINLCRFFLNLLFSVMKLFPVRKKVVFLSRQSNEPSLDILKLEEEITKSHPDYSVVILCKTIGEGIFSRIAYCFHILRQMHHLASGEIVILDSYSIAVSLLNMRRQLLVIQMWHSVGTMKKFAYSILDKPEGYSSRLAHVMRMHRGYDYILCAGEGYRSHLAEGFGYPEDRIVVLPLPRVEVLQDENYAKRVREKLTERYPQLSDRKNILYIPTFRKGNSEKIRFMEAVDDLKKAFKAYEDHYNLIIKPHPLSGAEDEYEGISSFEFLFAADYVISDYSCIIYEAAIRHIPLFFYTYDYDAYMADRDTYIDYPTEIPGGMYSNPEDLLKAVAADDFDMERQEDFLRKYVDYTMPNIIKSMVEFIFDHRKTFENPPR